tara:strand:+ start:224 stop:1732 length:1509 start_codon:yes stop_codon:yes gene_type:complete
MRSLREKRLKKLAQNKCPKGQSYCASKGGCIKDKYMPQCPKKSKPGKPGRAKPKGCPTNRLVSKSDERFFMTGNTNEVIRAQKRLLKSGFDPGETNTGKWGTCSHAAWLEMLDKMSMLADTPKTKKESYGPALKSAITKWYKRKVDEALVSQCAGWYDKISSTSGAAASTELGSAEDYVSGQLLNKDLMIKFLLSSEDKSDLPKTKAKALDILNKTIKGRSEHRKFSGPLKREYDRTMGNLAQGATGSDISFIRFIPPNQSRSVVSRLVSYPDLKAEIVTAISKAFCDGKTCTEQSLEPLIVDTQVKRHNIGLADAARDSARTGKTEWARTRTGVGRQLFYETEKTRAAVNGLLADGASFISPTGATINLTGNMQSMIRENAVNIRKNRRTLANDAAKRFAEAYREFPTSLKKKIKAAATSGKEEGEVLKDMNLALSAEFGPNWRAGYMFEAILYHPDMKEETDTSSGFSSYLDFGIGTENREERINEYEEAASNPDNFKRK